MPTTIKHQNFVAESMYNKDVANLAGIGQILAERLRRNGFEKAENVLGQYLLLKKDRGLFTMWLNMVCCANQKQANDCFGCLSDWCNHFL